jgi:hypothetical protein
MRGSTSGTLESAGALAARREVLGLSMRRERALLARCRRIDYMRTSRTDRSRARILREMKRGKPRFGERAPIGIRQSRFDNGDIG